MNNNSTAEVYKNITAYSAYITAHVADVKKAFRQYGDKLMKLFPDVSESVILKAIKNHDDSKTCDLNLNRIERNSFLPERREIR